MVEKQKTKHFLIPEHSVLSDEEKQELFEKYNITFNQLPNIHASDPALEELDATPGDVIKIVRKSKTNITSYYYRGVTNE